MEALVSFLGQYIVYLGVVMLLVGLLIGVWLFLRWRQREERRQQRLLRAGYERLSGIPAGLLDRVAAVLGRLGDPRLQLGELYHHSPARGELYLFNLLDKGAADNPVLAGALAIVAPELDLPRFRLLPRYETPSGARAEVVQRLLARQGRAGDYRPVPLGDTPAFAGRFLAFAPDVAAARDFLSPARREGVLALSHRYRIEGVGDTLLLIPHHSPQQLLGGERPSIDEAARIADALAMLASFATPAGSSAE